MLSASVLAFIIGIANVGAMPMEPPPPPPCVASYSVSSSNPVNGAPHVAGVSCTAEVATCTVAETESYSVAVTITEGINLGIDVDDVSAGITSSIAYTTTSGTADTGTATCPVGYTCGLIVTPSMLQADGTKEYPQQGVCEAPDGSGTGPYSVQFPILNSDGNPDINVEACTCPGTPGSTVPGGPILCPAPCNTA